jgi:hypothetical protein
VFYFVILPSVSPLVTTILVTSRNTYLFLLFECYRIKFWCRILRFSIKMFSLHSSCREAENPVSMFWRFKKPQI